MLNIRIRISVTFKSRVRVRFRVSANVKDTVRVRMVLRVKVWLPLSIVVQVDIFHLFFDHSQKQNKNIAPSCININPFYNSKLKKKMYLIKFPFINTVLIKYSCAISIILFTTKHSFIFQIFLL